MARLADIAQPPELAPPERAGSGKAGSAASIAKAAMLLVLLLAAGTAARVFDADTLAHAAPTLRGACALVAAGALLSAAGVPRQAVAFAGGYAFGIWEGGALAMLAQLLGCAADFWLARTIGRDWAIRRLRGRLARLDMFLAANPFTATLTLRLLPVGSNLALNLLAGISGVRAVPFLAATLLGYLPQTLVFALAGSGVHVNRSQQVALGIGLFAMSAILGMVLLKFGKTGRNGPVTSFPPV